MKRKRLFVLLLALQTAALHAWADPTAVVPPADASAPLLVWDVAPSLRDGLPRNFRTTGDPLNIAKGQAPDLAGLADLHASGSAEFTATGLKLMLTKLHGPVTIFDLRQESHVFVNGLPVSWYATNNWANAGKSLAEILNDESKRIKALAPDAKITLSDDKTKKGDSGAAATESLIVSNALTEAQVAANANVSYVRIPVSDHARPTDDEVDRFIVAVRQMPADGWAHFHCRAGKGRTTTFLALYDMLHNARRVSLEDIVNRQALLIGDYNLLQVEGEGSWKASVSANRAAFVRAFYDYALANPGGRPQIWTEWVKAQAASGK